MGNGETMIINFQNGVLVLKKPSAIVQTRNINVEDNKQNSYTVH